MTDIYLTDFSNPSVKYLEGHLSKYTGVERQPKVSAVVTYIISSQHSKVEGQQLQGDHAENALQTVH